MSRQTYSQTLEYTPEEREALHLADVLRDRLQRERETAARLTNYLLQAASRPRSSTGS